MKIWILTQEYNDYDQYGEYFIKAFLTKPTHQELTELGVVRNRLRHTLNGGGRVDHENVWFYLREVEIN
jgi:hypothetical protein